MRDETSGIRALRSASMQAFLAHNELLPEQTPKTQDKTDWYHYSMETRGDCQVGRGLLVEKLQT